MDWNRLKFWKPRADQVDEPTALVPTRGDGWENQLTGLGQVGRDKGLYTRFVGDELVLEEAEQLWQFDDLAAKVVEKLPAEAFREAFDLVVPDDKELGEEITAFAEDLDVEAVFQHAAEIERALGGAAVFPVINDGSSDLSQPLNEDRIADVRKLVIFDPRELQAESYYEDFQAPKFGMPERYYLTPVVPTVASPMTVVHESRLIIFPGIRITRRADARRSGGGGGRGWGLSTLSRCHRILRQYNVAWDSAGALLHDFSQAVIKVSGLAEMLSVKGEDAVRKRLLNLDLQRSVIRAMILDSEESFERSATPMGGLPELMDRFATRFAAAADMPTSVLFGDAPAGLNATGQADRSTFQDSIKGYQRKHIVPRLNRMFQLIMLSRGGPTGGKEPKNWVVKFRPLEQMTEAETADLRNKMADTDTKYITGGVLSPEEVAVSRFGGDAYSIETVIDIKGRGEPQAPDNTPPAPPAPGQPGAPPGAPQAPNPAPGGAPPPGKPQAPSTKAARKDNTPTPGMYVDDETLGILEFLAEDQREDTEHAPAGTPEGGQFISGHASGGPASEGAKKKKIKLLEIGEKGYTGANQGGGHAIQKFNPSTGKWETLSTGHSEVSATGQATYLANKGKYKGTGGDFRAVHEATGEGVSPSVLGNTYAKRLTANLKNTEYQNAKLAASKAEKSGQVETPKVEAVAAKTATPAPSPAVAPASEHFAGEFATLSKSAAMAPPADWPAGKLAAKADAEKVLKDHANAKTPEELTKAADAFSAVANKASDAGSVWGSPYQDLADKMRERAESLDPKPQAGKPDLTVHAVSTRPIASIQGSDMPLHEFHAARIALASSLPIKERKALEIYSGPGSSMNRALRHGGAPTATDKLIDSAIAKSPAPRDLTIHRGVSSVDFMGAIKVGGGWTDKGYSSSSAGDKPAFGGTHLIITVPKGYPVAPMGIPHENEMLLRRNTKFIITKHDKVGGYHVIHATVVHDESVVPFVAAPHFNHSISNPAPVAHTPAPVAKVQAVEHSSNVSASEKYHAESKHAEAMSHVAHTLGTSEAHATAGGAHLEAAKAAQEIGDIGSAQYHQSKAAEHKSLHASASVPKTGSGWTGSGDTQSLEESHGKYEISETPGAGHSVYYYPKTGGGKVPKWVGDFPSNDAAQNHVLVHHKKQVSEHGLSDGEPPF